MTSAPIFKKKGIGKRDVRARDLLDLDDVQSSSSSRLTDGDASRATQEASSDVIVKKRKTIGARGGRNALLQNSTRRKYTGDDGGSGSDYDLDDECFKKGDEGRAQWSREDATRSNTWYDDSGEGAGSSELSGAARANDDGMYHGVKGYSSYIAPHDDGKSSKAKTAKGPMRDTNVRTVTMFDYNPESCRSYKETGYCGFGDTCKFLHDRSDYLKGWQLDSVENADGNGRQRGDLGSTKGSKKEEEELPFACLICRKPFSDPIVTKCGHYFCEQCALKRYARNSKCFACGKRTDGLFQRADKLLKRLGLAKAARKEEEEDRNWAERNEAQDEDRVQTSGQLLNGVEIG